MTIVPTCIAVHQAEETNHDWMLQWLCALLWFRSSMGDFLLFFFSKISSWGISAQSIISFCPHQFLWKTKKMFPGSLFSYWTSPRNACWVWECQNKMGSWNLASSLQPKPLFQISWFVSIRFEHDQTKIQCLTSLTAHMGMSLVQLQKESGSSVQTEGKTACSVCNWTSKWVVQYVTSGTNTSPFFRCWQVYKQCKTKRRKKNAAEVFCNDLRRRKIYTADWLASWWDWSGVSNVSADTGEKA